MVVALVLGAAFYWFNRQEQSIATGETVLLTAESKLIAALREESEAQLKQKDQAILDIQGRLSAIDQERQELRSGVQAALSAKEQELLGQFDIDADTYDFTKIRSGRKLWNFDKKELDLWKAAF